jgi:hypothetical protein
MAITLPLPAWLGIATFLSLFATFLFGFLMMKGKNLMRWHKLFAILTLLLAVVHAILVFRLFYS